LLLLNDGDRSLWLKNQNNYNGSTRDNSKAKRTLVTRLQQSGDNKTDSDVPADDYTSRMLFYKVFVLQFMSRFMKCSTHGAAIDMIHSKVLL
jgi:hypothetical protein